MSERSARHATRSARSVKHAWRSFSSSSSRRLISARSASSSARLSTPSTDDDPADGAPYSDAKGCPPAGACVRLDRTLFSTEGHFFEVPFPEALGPFGSLKAGLEPVCDAHAGAM